jgi:predicted aspartyl protease
MRPLIITLFSLLAASFNLSFAQNNVSLNQGGTTAKKYFVSINYEKTIDKFIIIKATIEGKTYRFLFDTGASCMISKSLYDELNLPILHRIPVLDSNNLIDTTKVVSLNNVVLGGIEFNDIPAIVANNDSNIIFDCLEIDGIIGSNLLRNSIVQLSSKERAIYITDTPERFNLDKQYSTSMFLTPNQSSPYIWISINDKRKRRVQVLFDSGCNDFLVLSLRPFNAFKKRRMPYEILSTATGNITSGLHGLANDTTLFRLKSRNLRINQSNFSNVIYETTRSNNSKIGVELVEYGLVTLDFFSKKFYFEPFPDENSDLNHKLFPITPMVKDDKYVVGVVWDENLRHIINVGDQVLSIDNMDFSNMTVCEIFELSPFHEKSEIMITLKNGEGLINSFKLTRE